MVEAEPKSERVSQWTQENARAKRYNKFYFLTLRKKNWAEAKTPTTTSYCRWLHSGHPYTPNILLLITLQCTCAFCLFPFHQSGTHSFDTLGICSHESMHICALVRFHQHLILHVLRNFDTFVLVCVVRLHTVRPDLSVAARRIAFKCPIRTRHHQQAFTCSRCVVRVKAQQFALLHGLLATMIYPHITTWHSFILGFFWGRLPMPLQVPEWHSPHGYLERFDEAWHSSNDRKRDPPSRFGRTDGWISA